MEAVNKTGWFAFIFTGVKLIMASGISFTLKLTFFISDPIVIVKVFLVLKFGISLTYLEDKSKGAHKRAKIEYPAKFLILN